MERWSAVEEEGVPLATLRIYKGYSRGASRTSLTRGA